MLINERIAKFRSQIMGIAAIGVLLVHSRKIVGWSPVIKKLFGYGGIGVYVFVFLSAVGLYNSLKSSGGGYSKPEFYKRRAIRLIVPYCMIAGTWYGLVDLLIERNLALFLYDISTWSFWLEHKGAWYVAMLIPVYIFFPWFYDWAEKKNRDSRVLGSLVLVIILGFVCDAIRPRVYEHLSQVISSVIVYLIGFYYAGLDDKSNKSGILLGSICCAAYVVKAVTPLKNIEFVSNLSWAMLGIPIVFISAWCINAVQSRYLNCVLGFFGKYSLEMYLCNIFIIQAMTIFYGINFFKSIGDERGYVTYAIVVILGCLLSVIYGKISALLSNTLMLGVRSHK